MAIIQNPEDSSSVDRSQVKSRMEGSRKQSSSSEWSSSRRKPPPSGPPHLRSDPEQVTSCRVQKISAPSSSHRPTEESQGGPSQANKRPSDDVVSIEKKSVAHGEACTPSLDGISSQVPNQGVQGSPLPRESTAVNPVAKAPEMSFSVSEVPAEGSEGHNGPTSPQGRDSTRKTSKLTAGNLSVVSRGSFGGSCARTGEASTPPKDSSQIVGSSKAKASVTSQRSNLSGPATMWDEEEHQSKLQNDLPEGRPSVPPSVLANAPDSDQVVSKNETQDTKLTKEEHSNGEDVENGEGAPDKACQTSVWMLPYVIQVSASCMFQ